MGPIERIVKTQKVPSTFVLGLPVRDFLTRGRKGAAVTAQSLVTAYGGGPHDRDCLRKRCHPRFVLSSKQCHPLFSRPAAFYSPAIRRIGRYQTDFLGTVPGTVDRPREREWEWEWEWER